MNGLKWIIKPPDRDSVLRPEVFYFIGNAISEINITQLLGLLL